jgi:hypothetical protein
MKKVLLLPVMALVLQAQRPWQQMTMPSVGEAAAHFHTPPREYGAIHWAIWGGELTQATQARIAGVATFPRAILTGYEGCQECIRMWNFPSTWDCL